MGRYNSPVKSISNILHRYNSPIRGISNTPSIHNSRSIPTYPIFITFVGWLDDIPFGTISLYPIPIESLLSIKISCNNTYYPILF